MLLMLIFAVYTLFSTSRRTCSVFGTRLYRSTLYPAAVSSAVRAASCLSFPMWLLSSSSIIAFTLKAFEHMTKSATFRSKRFRAVRSVVVIKAENATCASTTSSGNASASLKNIGSSLAVNGRRALIAVAGGRRVRCFSATEIAVIHAISMNKPINFILSPYL